MKNTKRAQRRIKSRRQKEKAKLIWRWNRVDDKEPTEKEIGKKAAVHSCNNDRARANASVQRQEQAGILKLSEGIDEAEAPLIEELDALDKIDSFYSSLYENFLETGEDVFGKDVYNYQSIYDDENDEDEGRWTFVK